MKGIILAGGSGTRLYPITEGTSKQLVPVYDKPMIYYPLSVLMRAGIRDILVITTKEDQENFKRALGDGSKYGINLSYIIQPSPDGLAQAFILGEEFIAGDACAMVLGDNIFYGNGLEEVLKEAYNNAINGYATIFGYQVRDPERFGIMEIDKNNKVLSVEEKPEHPKSDFAITGLYFYPTGVSELAKEVKPSKRGELEITTLNDMYLKKDILKAALLGEGYTWFDTGTFDSLLDASNMIRTIQNNKDKVICSPEVIAYHHNWLTDEELEKRANLLSKNSYGKYLKKVLEKGKNRMKFLITGVNGGLGHDVKLELERRGFTKIIAPTRQEMDLTDEEIVKRVFLRERPDVVFHCAAYTAVDKAEEEKTECFNVNVNGTKNIVKWAEYVDAKIIYISTDYVFDGTGNKEYFETDEVKPVNYYGQTKYLGEEEVKKCANYIIARISWVFGINGKNFVKTMLKLAETKKEINVVSDQVGSPTYTKDLASILVDISLTDIKGTYHITNEGFCSWYEFAKYIFEVNGIDIKVNPIKTSEYITNAKRPLNSRLSKEKLASVGISKLPPWEDAVKRYSEELKKEGI